MRIHEFRTQQPWFDEVRSGKKAAEVRFDDRNVEPGDLLHLHEWHPVKGYSGAAIEVGVTHVLKNFEGLREGWAVYSLAPARSVLLMREHVAP